MKHRIRLCVVLWVGLMTAVQAVPTLNSGSLVWNAGEVELDAEGSWENAQTSLTWSVALAELNGTTYWHYEYWLTTPSKAVSHFILQVSNNLDASEIVDENYNIDGNPGIYSLSPSNPGMDGSFYGVKFDTANAGDNLLYLEFYTRRNPMWGNFYAKGGSNSSLENAVLATVSVPDTSVIPAPGAVLLAGVGTMVVGWLRRRRSI